MASSRKKETDIGLGDREATGVGGTSVDPSEFQKAIEPREAEEKTGAEGDGDGEMRGEG